jgi:NAD(P)-dependent dehydrogenase (short-subunit alcohol dehydrogenase family)
MFTYELAKRLKGTGVTVNALHPGVVKTNFANDSSGFMGFFLGLDKRFAGITPEQGADTVGYLATSPEVKDVTGTYFHKRRAQKTNPISYAASANQRLWAESARLVKLAV